FLEIDAPPVAAALGTPLAAGAFDEDAAHGLGRGGEEVAAAVPLRRVGRADQAEVGLVDQGGGLEGLAGLLLRQLGPRQLPQFVVDEGQQLVGGLRVSLLDSTQDARHLTHRRHSKARTTKRYLTSRVPSVRSGSAQAPTRLTERANR